MLRLSELSTLNLKPSTSTLSSLFGMYPLIFVGTSLGSGLNKIIDNNLEPPTLTKLLLSSEIYIPILGFIILLVIGIMVKNFFYKK